MRIVTNVLLVIGAAAITLFILAAVTAVLCVMF